MLSEGGTPKIYEIERIEGELRILVRGLDLYTFTKTPVTFLKAWKEEDHVNSITMHVLTCWKTQSMLPAPKNRPLTTLDTETPATRALYGPSLSNSLRRLLSTSSSCTSSIVGSLQPLPSPLSPGNGSQPSGASPCPLRSRFSNASFSFSDSYSRSVPSSSSKLYP
jgi:hypothetical protein